ncbi:hypothetical protein FB451DRAFT_1170373 [Mycena latifolia]|nr:hypothetical protein FB451DRAFT_1170373 [Mycena latifolia]
MEDQINTLCVRDVEIQPPYGTAPCLAGRTTSGNPERLRPSVGRGRRGPAGSPVRVHSIAAGLKISTRTRTRQTLGSRPVNGPDTHAEPYNHLVRQVEFQQNKSLVLWDLDSRGSLNAMVEEIKGIYDATINAIVSTLLALNHEIECLNFEQNYDCELIEELIGYAVDALQTANYSLVTVAECLGFEPSSFVGSFGQRDDTWFCPYDDSD